MREIKARIWDGVKFGYITIHPPGFIGFPKSSYLNHCQGDGYVVLDDCELAGEYTGLKDENDVDIYEGDICKITEVDEDSCTGREFTYYGEVIYKHGYWGFRNKKHSSSLCLGQYDWTRNAIIGKWRAEYEVIGNIYQNPELLEKQ